MTEKLVTLCFKVRDGKYRAIKSHAARNGLMMQEMLSEALDTWMDIKHIDVIEINRGHDDEQDQQV